MTNKKAQIVIGNIPIKPEVLDDCYDITEYQEAKAMAIKALAQDSITWIVGKDNCQVAVRNMPIDKMQKICAIIGEEEQQLNEDCISRQFLLNNIEEPMNWTDSEAEIQEQKDYESFVALVKSAPPVTPRTNLAETSQDVIDKIKAEILDEAEYAYADFDKYKEDILYAEPDELPDDDFRYGLRRAVEIINKYKLKSEDLHLPPLYQIGFQDGYMRAIYDNNKGEN